MSFPLLALVAHLAAAPVARLPQQQQPPVPPSVAGISTDDPILVRARVVPDTVYVGQQATFEVWIFVDTEIRSRIRRNPTFTPPEMRGTVVYDLPVWSDPFPEQRLRSREYEPHVNQRAIFPLVPGSVVVPAAQLLYAVPVSGSFFSKDETRILETDSLSVVVRPLPERGKPVDFTGAVGDLRVEARLDTAPARVGDPVLLIVRVSGRGNIRLLPRPMVSIPWGSLIAASDRVEIDSAGPAVQGAKEFAWVVTPRVPGDLQLGAIRYPYFDPQRQAYEVALSQPVGVHVDPGTLVAAIATADSIVPLSLRRDYRRAHDTRPTSTRLPLWIALAIAPLPFVVTLVARRPRTRRRRQTAVQRLRALPRAPTLPPASDVRRALVAALAERLHLRSGVLASRTDFVRALRHAGVSAATAARADALMAALDAAAYGDTAPPTPVAQAACDLFRDVDAEARPSGALVTAGVALAIALLVVAGTATAQTTEGTLFTSGVTAYDARRFSEAAQLFRAATRLDATAPDIWANLGTASAMTGDTGSAVAAWQRALRLEPGAEDVRARLTELHASTIGSLDWVPPVPTIWLAGAAAALWLLGWVLACLGAFRGAGNRRGAVRPLAIASVGTSLLCAGAAFYVRGRFDARDLAVVAAEANMRDSPALGADVSGRLNAGMVVRVRSRQGEWMRVQSDGGHEGWLTSDRVIAIERD